VYLYLNISAIPVLDVPEGTVVDILGNPDYQISRFLELVKEAGLDRNYGNPGNSLCSL